jgi:hypothetical protein
VALKSLEKRMLIYVLDFFDGGGGGGGVKPPKPPFESATDFTIIALYVHANFDINLLSISMKLLLS